LVIFVDTLVNFMTLWFYFMTLCFFLKFPIAICEYAYIMQSSYVTKKCIGDTQ